MLQLSQGVILIRPEKGAQIKRTSCSKACRHKTMSHSCYKKLSIKIKKAFNEVARLRIKILVVACAVN